MIQILKRPIDSIQYLNIRFPLGMVQGKGGMTLKL